MILLDPQTMLPEHYSETELGMWKFEACSAGLDVCDYQIKGRKDYRCRHDIKMKGTPKIDIHEKPILTHDNYEGNFWRFDRVVKMRESLRNKNLIPYSLKETTRRRLY